MSNEQTNLSIVATNEDVPHHPQTGHYFDQTIFDLHYTLQAARARRMALEDDLARQGIIVDPATGVVSFTSGKTQTG